MSPDLRRGKTLLLVVVTGLVVVSSVAAVGDVASNRQDAPPQSLSDTTAAANQIHPVVTNATPPTTGPAWGVARGNPANTNYLDTSGPTSPITTRWTLALDPLDDKAQNWFTAPPVVANGTLFVGARHHQKGGKSTSHLYAVDAWTGEENWRFTPRSAEARNAVNAVAVFRDTVYVATKNNKVYALKASTGEVFWSFETDGQVSGVTVANRTLYVTSSGNAGRSEGGGHVYGLDALTGEEQWRFTSYGDPAGWFNGPPTVVNGNVYLSERYSRIFALDAQTGAERWHVRVDKNRDMPGTPVVANGLVYVRDNDQNNSLLFALDAETGNQEWRYDPEVGRVGAPAVMNETVFLGTKNNGTYALNAETGEERWHINSPSGTPVLVNGHAYIGTGTGIYALDPATGEKKSEFRFEQENATASLGLASASGMAVLNGSLYTTVGIGHQAFGTYDTLKLYALGTPEFTYSNLSVTPQNVDPGEPVTATVTVSNTGTGPGAFNATLTVDGDVVNRTTDQLDAGASRTVTFTHVFEEDGAYTVGISGLTRNIGVGAATPAPSPTPTPTATETAAGGGGDGPPTATPTPSPTPTSTPGFGVAVWVVALLLLVAMLAASRRN